MRQTALTIAGSDPSGGAGIQADIKVFHAFGVYGLAVPSALTAQSTRGVSAVMAVPSAFFKAQLAELLDDIRPDAVKTGMLLTKSAVETTAGFISSLSLKNLVIDPVLISTSGKRLLRADALKAMVEKLFPLAALVTPNAAEAESLAGMKIRSEEDIAFAAGVILSMGPGAVLIKGGHLPGGSSVDYLADGVNVVRFTANRQLGIETHGTGCVLSAAITACLARGISLTDAVADAKRFVTDAMYCAVPVGRGRVPIV